MRAVIYVTVIVVVLLVLAYFSFYFYKERRNALAESVIKDAVVEINDFKIKYGDYPESFNELLVAEKGKKKVLLIFPPSKIYYHKYDNTYRISYHIFPFGPFYCYEKEKDEWFYEE